MRGKIKKGIRKLAAGLLFAGLVLNMAGCGVTVERVQTDNRQQEDGETRATSTAGRDFAAIPRPQDDFYGYVNKEYLDSLTVSYTDKEGVGGMADMMQTVDAELYQMITEIAASGEAFTPGSNEQLVRDAYGQILDYLNGGATGGKEHFSEVVDRIQAAGNIEEWKSLLRVLLQEEGITAYFSAGVENNYYDGESHALTLLRKRDFAGFDLKEIYTRDETRQNLNVFACNILIAAGEDVESAREKAKQLVYFVMDVSCHTDFSNDKAQNPYLALDFSTDKETEALLAGMTSKELAFLYDMENPYGGWVIEDEAQLAFMAECLKEENLEVLKSWLICEVLYEWRLFLQKDFAFLEEYEGQSRESVAMLAVRGVCELLETQVSELYAKYYYTEEMDAQLGKMYEDIKASYRELIQGADWLTLQTRERLLRKLENMNLVCGAGKEHVTDPRDAGVIGADAFDTFRRVAVWKAEANRKEIGTRIDREVAGMSSYIVNAQYSLSNSFTISVGIMHAPYFDVDADYAENLGALGIVIGHEMGHAFDSMCIDYDENGAYDPEGICQEDREKLAVRLGQMEHYYDGFAIMDIYYVDGKLTSGENYADKGAMECLMNIVKSNADREKVFWSFARAFAVLKEDNYAIGLLDQDEHSPDEVRANAVLSATDEFYEVYGVVPGDGMYVPPEQRVSRYR